MRTPKDQDRPTKPAGRHESALPQRTRKDRKKMKAAVPPVIDPDAFERFEGFRETTLALFTDAKANATLRSMADFIFTISLEYSRYWPDEPEGYVHHQCRAVVADLRHLQGTLAMLSEIRASRITRACERLSPRVKKIADALEKALTFQEDEE